MPFKLLWESRTEAGKRKYSSDWSSGARAYLRGNYAGHAYFESLETGDRKLAQINFTKRAAEIVTETEARKRNKGRCNFAYAVTLYFGTSKPEERDPTGRISKIFDKWGTKFLDEISQVDLNNLAVELHPNAGPKTLNREVFTPFIAVYNAAVDDNRAPQKRWKRPDGCYKKAKTVAPGDADINKLIAAASDIDGRNELKALRNRAAILTITLTGERTTAATVKLRWCDIDFTENTIYFPETKNGKERLVLMPPLLARTLATYKEAANPKPDDIVFGWKTRFGISQMIQHARKKAGLTHYRPHDIGRHGFARRMLRKGGLKRPQLKRAGNWESDAAVERYEHFELDEIDFAVRDIDTSELEVVEPRNKRRNRENGAS
ncbi:MAG: tyrosine-type recombinase/integrase [Proteobacteria bacterium]|nr:tyrosine-type recombinase/integrase [Pseudomonadota bacterium]